MGPALSSLSLYTQPWCPLPTRPEPQAGVEPSIIPLQHFAWFQEGKCHMGSMA